ncbi:sorting nexin-11 [Austrofundulus limnaeus]|uniref:Sorting nexin-11 n=1 Tax=Austrofundulus limnaeus TaxID=52670 RepID=A0A2I4BR44_AUSLI|nr:PREDICTED: sorting nexin-11 [Austrofundulus limnaeus]
MSRNQVDDEFIAVRVQDPRIQNEGSWNSYVDYKIFIHTNSKAFTAKTSCVRRRYSEFVWLKKKLQKNAGLVPVPDLPGKSIFYFSNEDFLERRRKGLQVFLNKVVHMTVCLSDSQLHLFLQTQLPVGHIQDCVQGLTPFSVMDAILNYASSNQGLAQAQEEESIREPSLTISYESMESPAPHQPHVTPNPEVLPCEESDPSVDVLDSDEMLHKKKPSVRISQKSHHLEVVVEDREPTQAIFYLGENPRDPASLGPAEQTERRSCLIQTPVEVHSPMETECELDNGFEEEESGVAINTDKKSEDHSEAKENQSRVSSEPETGVKSEEVLSFRVNNTEEVGERVAPKDVCSEKPDLRNPFTSQVYKGLSSNVQSERETNSDDEINHGSGRKDETIPQSEVSVETQNVDGAPEGEPSDSVQENLQQEVELTVEDEILIKTSNVNGAPEVESDYLVQERHKQEVEHVDKNNVLQAEVHKNGTSEVEPTDWIQEKHQHKVEHKDREEPLLQSEIHQNGNSAPEGVPSDLVQEKHQQEVEHKDKNNVLLQPDVHESGAPEEELRESVQEKQQIEQTIRDEILQSELLGETQNGNSRPERVPSDSVQENPQQEVEHIQSEVHEKVSPEVEPSDSVHQVEHAESEEDSTSLTSSDESIVQRSEEGSVCENSEDVRNWSENILDLHVNGSLQDEEDMTNTMDLIKSPELQPITADGDLTENGDFSILETSCLTEGDKFTKQEAPSTPLLNGSEETHYGQ